MSRMLIGRSLGFNYLSRICKSIAIGGEEGALVIAAAYQQRLRAFSQKVSNIAKNALKNPVMIVMYLLFALLW